MAFDTYVQISSPGVTGEATADGYAGWIEIYSFSWGASNPNTVGSGATGISAGKVSVSSFNVMKKTEASSAPLFAGCCAGQHYATVEVDMRKATGVDVIGIGARHGKEAKAALEKLYELKALAETLKKTTP